MAMSEPDERKEPVRLQSIGLVVIVHNGMVLIEYSEKHRPLTPDSAERVAQAIMNGVRIARDQQKEFSAS